MHGSLNVYLISFGLIVGGLIAASSLIIAKKPNAKDLLAKLAPYQGYIGTALFALGIWGVLFLLPNLKFFLFALKIPIFKVKFFAIMYFVSVPVAILLGTLLGVSLVTSFMKGETVKEKGDAIRAKLMKVQVPLGLVGVITGVLMLIAVFMLRSAR